jgi:hypothetical protein
MGNGTRKTKKTPPDLKVVDSKTETEIDPAVAALKVAPITVGNPDSAADLSIDQSHLEEYATAEARSSAVECRRPPKGHYFCVRPEPDKERWKDRKFYYILELEGYDPHIVTPDIAKQKSGEDVIRPLLLCRYVTMIGVEGLWPVKLNSSEGRSNAWNSSARIALELAETKWIRLISAKTEYRSQPSDIALADKPPQFSDRSFDELVNLAFEDRVVRDLDHTIWSVLARGSKK